MALLLVCCCAYADGNISDDYDCAREIHVAEDGKKNNPGTAQAPKKSIHAAAWVAKAGDCVLVHPGRYAVSTPIRFANNGRAGQPIVLSVWKAPLSAVIDSSGHERGRTISIENDHVIVDGFDFVGMPTDSGAQVVFFGTGGPGKSTGAMLRNNRVTGGKNHLKINGFPTGITVERNEFYGKFGHIPISITGARDLSLRNNHFHNWDNGGRGAIQIKGGSRNVIVSGNLLEDISGLAGAIVLGDGCDSSCNFDAENYAGRELVAKNNVLVRVGRGFDVYGCIDCSILNNTMVDVAASTVAVKFGTAVTGGIAKSTANARFINNVIWNPSGALFGLLQVNDGSAAGLLAATNLVWNGGHYVNFGGSAPAEFVTSFTVADPGFKAGPEADYVPGPGSAARDSGTPVVEVRFDTDGAPRPDSSGIDIGAFEGG